MILFRNRGIISGAIKFVAEAIAFVYKIISLLHLQLTLLVVLLGFILFVIVGIEPNGVIFIIFVIALFLSILVAVVGTVRSLLGLNKKKDKKRSAQIVETPSQPINNFPTPQQNEDNASETPLYFRAKENPNYVFAEYSDRYELYKISNGQLVKIRTDYKS